MSFILDALKKLEREKESREPGVVMVGTVPWGGADRRSRGRRLAVVAAALVLVGAIGFWWLGSSPGPTAPGPEPRPPSERGGASSSPPGSPTEDRPPPARRPPRPSVQERPAAGAAESPGASPVRASTVRPPAPRRSALPVERTTAGAGETDLPVGEATPGAGEADLPVGASTPVAFGTDRVSGDTEPATPEPLASVEDVETPPVGPVETGLSDTSAATTSAPVPRFRLTAISTRDGEPIALLNDRLVREGDSFDGIRVIRIGTAEVEIEVDGERRTVGF